MMFSGSYFLAFLFSKELSDLIQEVKLEISEKTNSRHSLKIPPHITLMPPQQFSNDQIDLLDQMLLPICAQAKKEIGSLDGFGHFRKDVIFLNTHVPPEIYQLQETIMKELQRSIPDVNWRFNSHWHPHTTLAFRDLEESSFEELWPEIEFRPFKADFVLDRLCLLKHVEGKWTFQKDYPFLAGQSKQAYF